MKRFKQKQKYNSVLVNSLNKNREPKSPFVQKQERRQKIWTDQY